MNTITEININKEILLPKEWKSQKDKTIDFDYVIDAYLEGKRVGREQAFDELKEKLTLELQTNINKAIEETENLIELIKEIKIEVKDIWLRVQPHVQTDFLISVSTESFLSPNFKNVYSLARKKKKEANSNILTVSYSFIPYSKEVNEAQLKHDGYNLKRNEQ